MMDSYLGQRSVALMGTLMVARLVSTRGPSKASLRVLKIYLEMESHLELLLVCLRASMKVLLLAVLWVCLMEQVMDL